MIKIYGMSTCPDCYYIEGQIKGNDKYQVIDIAKAKEMGAAGIPCFVLEDGTVTLIPEEAGLQSRPVNEGATCNIDGSGC